MDRTNENIKKYYSSKSLSEEKVKLLLGNQTKKRGLGDIIKFAIAAMLIIGFVFTFMQFQSTGIENLIVKEIAMNHTKELKVEFLSDNLNYLQAKLDKLDFPLDKAQSVLSDDYTLIGGRYCSIQGNLAAQLKIKNNETGSIETLYVTGINSDLENVKHTNVDTDGVNIKIWQQDGLVYGKAVNIK